GAGSRGPRVDASNWPPDAPSGKKRSALCGKRTQGFRSNESFGRLHRKPLQRPQSRALKIWHPRESAICQSLLRTELEPPNSPHLSQALSEFLRVTQTRQILKKHL
ncbi:hypothetical protein K0M31_010068, partial [Melipona bicolor]